MPSGSRSEPESKDVLPGLVGGLVQRAVVAITDYVGRGLHTAGYDISPARAGNVMRNITPEGATIVAIARSAGVSKQAISRQAEGLQKLGYVSIESSDLDRRVRIVKPTAFSLRSRDVAAGLYEDIASRIEEKVGREDMAAFRRVLTALHEFSPKEEGGA
jgi:DNA-binding MarR family transcriptional regulator